jgi:hypothetical protein
MAKSRRDELFDQLRVGGLRKSVARRLADAMDSGRTPRKQVDDVLDRLRAVTSGLEDRATGGPSKRSAAAKKAAATRKRRAAQRSSAAKKAAATRAKAR